MSTIDPAACRGGWRRPLAQQARCASWTRRSPAAFPRATDGTLAIMVGGDARDFEEARPALAAMGANVIHVGAVGSGEVGEALQQSDRGRGGGRGQRGVPDRGGLRRGPQGGHRRHLQVLGQHLGDGASCIRCRAWCRRAASSHDYAPGFMTDLMCKDLGPRRGRGARAAGAGLRDARGAAGLPPRVLPRPRARSDFTSDLLVPQAFERRRACLKLGAPRWPAIELGPGWRTPPGSSGAPRRSRGRPLCACAGFGCCDCASEVRSSWHPASDCAWTLIIRARGGWSGLRVERTLVDIPQGLRVERQTS